MKLPIRGEKKYGKYMEQSKPTAPQLHPLPTHMYG